MTKLQWTGAFLVLFLALVGLAVLAIGAYHLYTDHQIDDRIRDIQRQQLQQLQQQQAPPPPVK